MIIADSREPQALLKKMKKRFGDDFRIESLAWGDYLVVGDRMKVVIERKSVVPDTLILAKVDGEVGIWTVEEIYEFAVDRKDIKVGSFNLKEKRFVWRDVYAVSKHKANKVYKLRSCMACEPFLIMSEDHNVWKIGFTGSKKLVETKKLRVGDSIFVPRFMSRNEGLRSMSMVKAYDMAKKALEKEEIPNELFLSTARQISKFLEFVVDNVFVYETYDEFNRRKAIAYFSNRRFVFGLGLLFDVFGVRWSVEKYEYMDKYKMEIDIDDFMRYVLSGKSRGGYGYGVRIESIEVEEGEFVLYDLAVKGTENFIGGMYRPILLHNTAFDLVASVNDKRLWKQIDGMRAYGEDWEVVLLIEGNKWRVIKSGRVTYPRWIGIIASLINIPRLKMIFVDDRDETIDIIANMNRRAGRPPREITFNNVRKENRTKEEEVRDVLMAFSGVGVVKAKTIMEREKSLISFFRKTKKKLMEEYGKIGEQIWEVLHYEFGGDKDE